jgi:hypothetical protein
MPAQSILNSPPIYGDTDNTLLLKIAAALASIAPKTTSTQLPEIIVNSNVTIAYGEALQIQNLGLSHVYVGYGYVPTTTSCNFTLNHGVTSGDGASLPVTITNFVGTVYFVFSLTGAKRLAANKLSA